MKLRHYTNSKESALSIIGSQQLWMGKTGEALKDRDEVNHYMKVFRMIHALTDIENALSNNVSYKPQSSLYESLILKLHQCYYLEKNHFMIGDVFAEIIRNESYIICFTNDDESTFHDSKYGPISFVFKDNPLREDLYPNFRFLQSEITYIESNSFDGLQSELDSFYKSVLSPFLDRMKGQEFHEAYNVVPQVIVEKTLDKKVMKKERKKIIERKQKLVDVTSGDVKKFLEIVDKFYDVHSLDSGKVSDIVNYLANRVNVLREDKILKSFDPTWAREHQKNGTFRNVPKEGHKNNIISCFLKDVQDQDDKETRIIALPSSVDENLQDNKLKVDLDMNLLEKVIISQEIEDREGAIEEIKSALQAIGLESVEVE